MQLRGIKGSKLSAGVRGESKQRIYFCTCAGDFIQYARLWKTFSGLLWQEATKTSASYNKDNSCSGSYVQRLCGYSSHFHFQSYVYTQYSRVILQSRASRNTYSTKKADFISMGEAQMGGKEGQCQTGESGSPCFPLDRAPLARWFKLSWHPTLQKLLIIKVETC